MANILLREAIPALLCVLESAGLKPRTIEHYRRAYQKLEEYAKAKGQTEVSHELEESFLSLQVDKLSRRILQPREFRTYRRATRMLADYGTAGSFTWRTYYFIEQPGPSSEQFQTFQKEYLTFLGTMGRSLSTIKAARNTSSCFLMFLERCGCNDLSNLTPKIILKFFPYMRSSYQSTSMGFVASKIRSILWYLHEIETGIDIDLLLLAIPSRSAIRKPVIPLISNDEMSKIRSVLHDPTMLKRDRAIMLLAIRTGMRTVDINNLRLNGIDWIRDRITLVQVKTKKPLELPLVPEVGNAIADYILNERPETDVPNVFISLNSPYRKLSTRSACNGTVARIMNSAQIRTNGERKGIHLFRHTVASRMLEHRVPITTISTVLGHACKESTDRYLSTNEEQLKQCILSLEGFETIQEALR
jgi:integrase